MPFVNPFLTEIDKKNRILTAFIPIVSPDSRRCSAGAGGRNRTDNTSLEGWSFAIKLRLRLVLCEKKTEKRSSFFVHFREKRKNFIVNVLRVHATAPFGTFSMPPFHPWTYSA